ncbi:hypothetical protein [Cumulibacter manganitolerans]|uniref:hypothetical protein n=1 Tax=Cumulibacter manganitolerans TaxID=1884992 RepID=UPI0012981D5F|nr:hypothetical protein [Cumulibacter manganitolerans]
MNGWLQAAIVVGSLVLSAALGWAVTVGVLRMAKAPQTKAPAFATDRQGHEVPVLQARAEAAAREPLLRGGMWIGIIERVAVTGSILAGMPALIAVVVAVKGLGRYPELKEQAGASERFIIGSLASLTVAVPMGLLGAWLLDH